MKKILILLSFLGILASCKKTNELLPDSSIKDSVNSNYKKSSPNKILSAADGQWDLLGYGYNVTGQYANSSAATYKIIDVERLYNDYPDRVETDNSTKNNSMLITGENAQSYSEKLSANLKATAGLAVFKSTITASYSDANAFSSKYVYGSYTSIIQQKRLKFNATTDLLKNYLSPSFLYDIQNSSPQDIVKNYGTHVLSDIILGAKLEILYQSETLNSDRTTAAAAGLDVSVGKIFNLTTGLNYDASSTASNFNQSLHYITYGGDPAKSLIGSILFDQSKPTINISDWSNSSNKENAELIDISTDGLIPIYDLIEDPAKKAAVKDYVIQYLLDNQVTLISDPYANTKPFYRLYNSSLGRHFYTTDFEEVTDLTTHYRWTKEGIIGFVKITQESGTVPLYRYYNSHSSDHFYTTVKADIHGFTYEGIIGYVYSSSNEYTNPIYRYYKTGDHFYVNFYADDLESMGYRYEGVYFYTLK